jgi:AAA domain
MKLIIKKPSDFIQVNHIITLIYGQPGTRKTSFASTAPKAILFDFDNGIRRVDEQYRCEYIPVDYLKDWATVEESITDPQFAEYETFIFDSVTKLMDYLTDFVIKKDAKNKKAGGGLTMGGYGALGNVFSSFLKKIEMMGKNIVFVAHDKEGKEGDATRLRPDIVGGSLGMVTRSADLIGYVEMVNNVSIIQFSPTDRFYAKNSCGLPNQINTSEVSLTNILETYKVGINEKSAELKRYKLAVKNGLALLDSVTDCDTLNQAWANLKLLEHAMTSKIETFGAFKDFAETVGCFFNKETVFFEEYEKAEIDIENEQLPEMSEELPKPKKQKNAKDKI